MRDRLSPERWQALSPHLDAALELSPLERTALLARLRGEDPALVSDLEAMLEQHAELRAAGFLETPPSRPGEPGPVVGTSLGPYTLRSILGQGGMGTVWLAERSDGRFSGQVAVKLLRAHLVAGEGEARFRREGSVLARLRHPHIAHLVDAGVAASGQPYLVLEHVEGQPIDAWCDEHALDVEARIRLFLDVLAAVAHAHANLVVHRDIKPSNVLVTTSGQVKLLDFGIAKLLDPEDAAEPALTREGHAALTPQFAAPEQLTGEAVTTATDVYSLGVLLFILLTGAQPRRKSARSPAELIHAVLETEPLRPSAAIAEAMAGDAQTATAAAALRGGTPEQLRRQLRGDLDTILARTLKRRAEERYPSAQALAEDLRRFLEHRPVQARPDSLSYRARKLVRRHRGAFTAAAAVVLLVVLLVAFYTRRLAAERDRARLEATKASQVSKLLAELLTGADPYADEGEVTLRQVLDAGAERIRRELGAQPELQAELLTLMGRTYRRLGHREPAKALLTQALAIADGGGGVTPLRRAETLNDLGGLLDEMGDYAAAQPLLEEALAVRRRSLGDMHPDVAATLVDLGRVHFDRGDPESAEPLLREALAIRRATLGDADAATATSESELGLLLRQRGDLAAAETHLRAALDISRRALGPDHPDVGTALGNVGMVAIQREDHATAEAMLREALAIARRALGPAHPDLAGKLTLLSHPLREQGKLDEAEAVAAEALRIGGTLGGEHPLISLYASNLARVHLAQGDARAAEPLLRRALAIGRASFGDRDWRVGATSSLLGEALTGLGRYDEAEAMLLAAQALLSPGPGSQGREAAANARRLATLRERRRGRAAGLH